MALDDLLSRSLGLLGRSWQLLGRSWQLSGSSRERLGRLLELFWSYVGELLGVRRHLESVSEVMFANIAKPSKTLEGIAKMEVPRSRSGWKIVKICIETQSFVEILMKSHPQAFKSSPRVAQESSKSRPRGPKKSFKSALELPKAILEAPRTRDPRAVLSSPEQSLADRT